MLRAPALGGRGDRRPGQASAVLILHLLALLLGAVKGIEVLEQCRIQNRKSDEQQIKGTLSYDRQIQTIKADFWKEGVGGSKRILKKILKKINNYEEEHTSLENKVNQKLGKRFKRLGREDVWYDEKTNRPIYKDEFCAAVDDLKANERKHNDEIKDIKYNCIETEQLYGIGYHKAYEQCKDDSFLSKFSVDFSVCLHAHYPWIDMLSWGVCVMKEYNNDFLACFCSTKNGKLDKRSFCITKIECFLHGQGLTKPRQMLVVKDSCMQAIEYFTEPGLIDFEQRQVRQSTWASAGLAWILRTSDTGTEKLDKLRVRAPFHTDSVCFEEQFSSDFDVGQFKQDLASTTVRIPPRLQVEVFVPRLEGYKIMPEDHNHGSCLIPEIPPEPRVEQPQCGPKIPETPISPQIVWKKKLFIEIYTERMVTTSVPWIPGLFFLYSFLLSDKSRRQKMFGNFVQFSVIILGSYNSIVSMVLWRSSLYTLNGPSQREFVVFVASVCFACCINYKEIGELFLILSLLHFASNILLLFLIPHLRTEENIIGCTVLSYLISVVLTVLLIFLIWRQVDKIDKKREKDIRWKHEMVETIATGRSREGERRRPGRGKGGQHKRPQPVKHKEEMKDFNQVFSEIGEEVRERSRIACQWTGCKESANIGYVSARCSGQCGARHFHTACWKLLLRSLDTREDRGVLGSPCPASGCQSRLARLSWYTGLGREVRDRRLVWDPAKQGRRGSQPKRAEPPTDRHKKTESRKVQSVAPTIRVPEALLAEGADMMESKKSKLEATIKSSKPAVAGEGFELRKVEPSGSAAQFELPRVASQEQISNSLSFGTIGSERKARNSLTVPPFIESLPSVSPSPQTPAYANSLLNDSLGWDDSFLVGDDDWTLEPQLPAPTHGRSKILSMIENTREPSQKQEHLEEGLSETGFIMKMDFCGMASSAVSYIPQSKQEGEQEEVTFEGNKFSLNYISGQPGREPIEQNWLLDGYDSDKELYNQLEVESGKAVTFDFEENNCPPLTRILRKALSGYTPTQIDLAMAAVLEKVDCQDITIPDFQGLVQGQLEAEATVDTEVDECHMCLEPLDMGELLTLDPCNHVFHTSCILPWLKRDSSCPKCRAKVI